MTGTFIGHEKSQEVTKTEVEKMDPELFYDEVVENGHLLLSGEAKLSENAEEFLVRVIQLLMETECELDKDHCLVRAQVDGDLVQDCYLDGEERPGIRAFQEARMIPNLSFCGKGRFHRKDEPGFYFAAEVKTAVKEMRPRRGLELSVAHFSPKRTLQLIHIKSGNWSRADKMKEAMGGAFSEQKMDEKIRNAVYGWCSYPITEMIKNEYVPSQLIAERLRDEGYDGIVYDSAMDGNGKIAGVLFCPSKRNPQQFFPTIVRFHKCYMKRVENICISFDAEYEQDPAAMGNGENCLLKEHKRYCFVANGFNPNSVSDKRLKEFE